jgi:hypothetical protein
MAWAPPGASTTCRRVAELTVRRVIVTGNGFWGRLHSDPRFAALTMRMG